MFAKIAVNKLTTIQNSAPNVERLLHLVLSMQM